MVYSYQNGVYFKEELSSPTLVRISNADGRILLEKMFVNSSEKPIFLSKAGTYMVEIENERRYKQRVVLN